MDVVRIECRILEQNLFSAYSGVYLVWKEFFSVIGMRSMVIYNPGGTPENSLYGEAPPKRGTFFRLQVYKRVEILLVEVYERVGKSLTWVSERAQKG